MRDSGATMETLPKQLRAYNQWVCWRRDKNGRKIPVDATTGRPASTTNADTWTDFDAAQRAYRADGGLEGVGFVFTKSDPFFGVDLDDCIRDDGALEPWAAEVVRWFSLTYVERSPSGRGVKVFGIGCKPPGACKRGKVECYDRGRYFTLTGERWIGTVANIVPCQEALDWLCRTYLFEKIPSTPPLASAGSVGSEISAGSEGSAGSVTPDDVITATLPKELHQRNAALLRLARGLKFDAGLGNLRTATLKPFVKRWHDRALPFIATEPFDPTWVEFVRAWTRARVPLFRDVLAEAFAAAKANPAPEAEGYDTPGVKLLVGLCRHLAGPEGRFFLSTHAAGTLLDAAAMTVHRWLGMLVADDLLELIERGNTHRATRWRWLGKTLDNQSASDDNKHHGTQANGRKDDE